MKLYRELSMALSYGRASKCLSPEQIEQLGQMENLIAGAEDDAELVNCIKLWAKIATQTKAAGERRLSNPSNH